MKPKPHLALDIALAISLAFWVLLVLYFGALAVAG